MIRMVSLQQKHINYQQRTLHSFFPLKQRRMKEKSKPLRPFKSNCSAENQTICCNFSRCKTSNLDFSKDIRLLSSFRWLYFFNLSHSSSAWESSSKKGLTEKLSLLPILGGYMSDHLVTPLPSTLEMKDFEIMIQSSGILINSKIELMEFCTIDGDLEAN